MLIIKRVTMKNFLSIGNVAQTVELDKNGLVLVLGENIDLGSSGSRNGVGKSALLQSISYGLYGQSLTNIKINNLINHSNQKNMCVSIDFEKDGHIYRIERGRKPNFFKYIVDNKNIVENVTDEAQGENKETQKDIDKILGMSHTLFKHIIAMNTYTEPFLSLGASKQREVIEELLGIMLLSQKAETLRNIVKETKIALDQEEFRIRTVKQSNDRIKSTLEEINQKEIEWEENKISNLENLNIKIKNLEKLDIEHELQSHYDLESYNQLLSSKSQLEKDLMLKNRHLKQNMAYLDTAIANYDKIINHECPTCGQELHDNEHENIRIELESKIINLDTQVKNETKEVNLNEAQLLEINNELKTMNKPITNYRTLELALNHRNTVDQLVKDLNREANNINPYKDQTSRTLVDRGVLF